MRLRALLEYRPVTETPEFQKWFQGSRMVNPDGSPRICYHGTAWVFDRFDLDRAGSVMGSPDQKAIWISTDPDTANHAADIAGSSYGLDPDSAEEVGLKNPPDNAGTVYPCYVRLLRPLISEMDYYNTKRFEETIAIARKKGCDGVVFPKLLYKGEKDQFCVFSPDQVRWAAS